MSQKSFTHSGNAKACEKLKRSIDSDEYQYHRMSIGGDIHDKLKAIDHLNKTLESQKKELNVLRNKVNLMSSP
jgi:predicted RNase H-like nuclease (RuvC/YqgF family)